MASPARRPAPSVVASRTGETSTGRPMASASACDEDLVVGHAAVDAQGGDRIAAVRLGRLDQVGAPMGHPFEHGPHDLGPARAPGEPDQGAPGAEVPDGRAQAEQRRARTRRRPWSRTGRPRSADSSAEAMRPRSSRSHSTQVPAESMTASVPQVAVPPTPEGHDREGAGAAPAGRGRAPGRRRCTGRACRRCRRWPWPGRAACSPGRRGRPAGRRRCRRWGARRSGRGRGRRGPRSRRCAGSIGRRDAQPLEQWLVPVDRGRVAPGAVTAAFVASVTWSASRPPSAPPESVQATQVSTVPKHSSPGSARARSGSTSSRMAITLVADALGASRMPSACSARQVPTVRRSCQPMPGAERLCRWPVPTRWSRPAGWRCPRPSTGPPSARRGPGHRQHGAGHDARRRTRPGRARACRAAPATWCTCSTVASGRTIAARTPEVPTSTTRTLPPRRRSVVHGGRPEGRGQAELARVEDAGGIEGLLERRPARRSRRRGPGAGSASGSARCRGGG